MRPASPSSIWSPGSSHGGGAVDDPQPEVKAAFRCRALRDHPDRHGGSSEAARRTSSSASAPPHPPTRGPPLPVGPPPRCQLPTATALRQKEDHLAQELLTLKQKLNELEHLANSRGLT